VSTLARRRRYWHGLVSKPKTGLGLALKLLYERGINMRKLIPILVAVVFAFSGGAAFAASHVGAKPMDSKDEMKKSDKKGGKKAAKKSSKKSSKKSAKKDEMAK
jgi:mannitol-specific phosphotransferase system IIBC component